MILAAVNIFVLAFSSVFVVSDFKSIMTLTAFAFRDDDMLKRAGPKDIHDWIDPDKVLDWASHRPHEDAPEHALRRVLTVGFQWKHRDAVDEAVCLHAGKYQDDNLQVVKRLGLCHLSESKLKLAVSLLLLSNTFGNEKAQHNEGYQKEWVCDLHDHVRAIIVKGALSNLVLYHMYNCEELDYDKDY